MDDDKTMTGAAPRSPWAKRGLILSLLGNLLLAGLLVGAGVRNHMHMMRGAGAEGFGPLVMAMSREDRGALRDSFKGEGDDWKAFRAENDKAFTDLAAIIAADPFDRAAAEAVLDRQSAGFDKRMAAGRGLLLDRIAGMSATDRAAFAERLRAALSHRD